MKPTRTSATSAVLLLAASGLVGCTLQTAHGPVSWTASDPASPSGQSDAQAWARSTSEDKAEGATERQASPPPVRWSEGEIELPSGTFLTASAPVSKVRPFPEEAPAPGLDGPDGTDQVFLNGRPYGEVVDFFERTIARDGADLRETTTSTATIWSFRRAGSRVAHVAVRNTRPTTIEIVEPTVHRRVSSAQP
jgi:hypothetical protein